MPRTIGSHKTSVIDDFNRLGDEVVKVKYHSTIVVKFNRSEGIVNLNSGGWHTSTTKRRMNQTSSEYNLGIRVFQRDYDWYVELPDGEVVDFHDGMKIDLQRSEVIEDA